MTGRNRRGRTRRRARDLAVHPVGRLPTFGPLGDSLVPMRRFGAEEFEGGGRLFCVLRLRAAREAQSLPARSEPAIAPSSAGFDLKGGSDRGFRKCVALSKRLRGIHAFRHPLRHEVTQTPTEGA